MTASPLSQSDLLPRRDRRIAGIAGLIGVVAVGVVIGFVSLPDVTAHGAIAAVRSWLADPQTGMGVTGALAVGAASYAFLLIFAGGVHRIARSWDPAGVWPSVAAAGFILFLAGALASDAFEWAVPLTLASAPGFTPDPALVAVLDRGWLISLMEAQLALATAVAAVTVAGFRSRRGANRAPLAVLIIGVIGAAAVIPFLLFPNTQLVLLVSNQTRLLWIVVMAIWMIVSARKSRDGSVDVA